MGLSFSTPFFRPNGLRFASGSRYTKMRIGEQQNTSSVGRLYLYRSLFQSNHFSRLLKFWKKALIDTLRAKSLYFLQKICTDTARLWRYWLPPQKVMINGFLKYQTRFWSSGYGSVDTLKQKLLINPLQKWRKFDALTQSIIYGVLVVLLLVD